MKENIRDYYNRIVGTIETDSSGNKIARDFYNRIVGTYNSSENKTRDFYNRIVSTGDTLVSLILSSKK